MKVLDYINNRNYKLTLEKLIIGVEEPIFIKGVGEILAKADSGNSAFNVLHGEDFYNQGNVVVFTTYDEEDKPHRVSKKVQGTVDINIGAGHTETRPIVLLDVKFAGEEYINVPFTIGNRANNKNKVLLGKEFLTKELDVLIDVSKDNISDKNIEVDIPVTEGAAAEQGGNNVFITGKKNNPSGATSKIMRGATKTYGAVKGAYNMLKNWGNSERGIFSKIKTAKDDWKQMMADINNYQKTDKELIFKYLTMAFQARHQRMDNIFNNPQVIKILDYLGNDYAGNNNIKQDEASEHYPNRSRVSEAVEAPTQQKNEDKTTTQARQNNIGIFKKAQAVVNKETKTIVYLVIYNGDSINTVKQILSSNYQNFNGDFSQIISAAELTAENSHTRTVSNNIVNTLLQNGINSAIVACSGIKGDRKVTEVTDIFKFTDGVEKSESAKADNQPESAEQPTSEYQRSSELATIESKYNNIDQRILEQMIRDSGHNPQLLNLYTIFSFIDKAKAYEFNSKESNIRKNVVLYYFVYSNIKPDSHKITNEFKHAEEIIKKLIPVFDINYISEAAKNYISLFNNTIKENGKLIACFGTIDDRQSVLLPDNSDINSNDEQADNIPELLPVSDSPLEAEIIDLDSKQPDRTRKKESERRRREWKKVLNSLPENYNDFSKNQQNQFYNAVNKITAGENNFQVPVVNNFIISKKIDNKIVFISSIKNGSIKIFRRKNNNRIYEYYVTTRNNGKRYIKLNNIKKIENTVASDTKTIKPATSDTNSKQVEKKLSEKVKKETTTAKPQKNGKKKKDIAEVIVTDKKTTNEHSQPKGTSKKRVRKNPFKHNRGQSLDPAADVHNATSALSKSVSKEALSSLKNILNS